MLVARMLVVVCLSVVMLAGCGKQELEDAKTRISDLSAKNQKLTDAAARREAENTVLAKEITDLRERNAAVITELDQLKKAHVEVTRKTEELNKKREQLEAEISNVKQENEALKAEVTDLRKQATKPPEQTGKLPEERGEMPQRTERSSSEAMSKASMNPCQALAEYMRKSRAVIARSKDAARQSDLEELRSAYADKIKEAPEAARKAAETWVKELSRSWDQVHDDSVFRLLELKNQVLSACGLSPGEAGL